MAEIKITDSLSIVESTPDIVASLIKNDNNYYCVPESVPIRLKKLKKKLYVSCSGLLTKIEMYNFPECDTKKSAECHDSYTLSMISTADTSKCINFGTFKASTSNGTGANKIYEFDVVTSNKITKTYSEKLQNNGDYCLNTSKIHSLHIIFSEEIPEEYVKKHNPYIKCYGYFDNKFGFRIIKYYSNTNIFDIQCVQNSEISSNNFTINNHAIGIYINKKISEDNTNQVPVPTELILRYPDSEDTIICIPEKGKGYVFFRKNNICLLDNNEIPQIIFRNDENNTGNNQGISISLIKMNIYETNSMKHIN